jgi:hypothetical protein
MDGVRYEFAPFRAEGSTANLNGENSISPRTVSGGGVCNQTGGGR